MKRIYIILLIFVLGCQDSELKKENRIKEKTKESMNEISNFIMIAQKENNISIYFDMDSCYKALELKNRKNIDSSTVYTNEILKGILIEVENAKKLKKIKENYALFENLKNLKSENYIGSIEKILDEINFFGNCWKALKFIKIDNPKKSKEFEDLIISKQKTEFPKMRKRYGDIVKDKLWEENIQVKVFGSGNTTIDFVAGIYASNKNIKDHQETLNDILHKLRFKRSQYRWYSGADYTYYTLTVPKDADEL